MKKNTNSEQSLREKMREGWSKEDEVDTVSDCEVPCPQSAQTQGNELPRSEVEAKDAEAVGIPAKEIPHLRTTIAFKGCELLLETDDPELVEEFQVAYHRILRHYIGDYA
jgi:hypothetical protein